MELFIHSMICFNLISWLVTFVHGWWHLSRLSHQSMHRQLTFLCLAAPQKRIECASKWRFLSKAQLAQNATCSNCKLLLVQNTLCSKCNICKVLLVQSVTCPKGNYSKLLLVLHVQITPVESILRAMQIFSKLSCFVEFKVGGDARWGGVNRYSNFLTSFNLFRLFGWG